MRPTRHNPSVLRSRILTLIFVVVWIVGFVPATVGAQGCAMCQTVMPRADEPLARGMFWSVLLLLSAPFVIGGMIGGWVFYQYRRARRPQRSAAVFPFHGERLTKFPLP